MIPMTAQDTILKWTQDGASLEEAIHRWESLSGLCYNCGAHLHNWQEVFREQHHCSKEHNDG